MNQVTATQTCTQFVRVTFSTAMEIDVDEVWTLRQLERFCDAEGYELTIV